MPTVLADTPFRGRLLPILTSLGDAAHPRSHRVTIRHALQRAERALSATLNRRLRTYERLQRRLLEADAGQLGHCSDADLLRVGRAYKGRFVGLLFTGHFLGKRLAAVATERLAQDLARVFPKEAATATLLALLTCRTPTHDMAVALAQLQRERRAGADIDQGLGNFMRRFRWFGPRELELPGMDSRAKILELLEVGRAPLRCSEDGEAAIAANRSAALARLDPALRSDVEGIVNALASVQTLRQVLVAHLRESFALFLRPWLFEVGARLVARRILASPSDAFFLQWSELLAACSLGNVEVALVRSRRAIYTQKLTQVGGVMPSFLLAVSEDER